MTKKKDDALGAEADSTPKLPQFRVAPLSDPSKETIVESFDGSIEEAVRQYNQGNAQPLTAKQLVITPIVESEAV